uniref:Peroxisomal biogenesis factor 3 n=1 Tax=Eptatretus burgeri TaxID=7764 RepID=A0A8C4R763_EPTBU
NHSSTPNFLNAHFKCIFVHRIVRAGELWQRKLVELQEQEATELLAQLRRQHHFENSQRTCISTVLSMIPSLRKSIVQQLESESLTAVLKSKPANKLEIWEDLKILGFSRAIVAVYSTSTLAVLLCVQLNIIGGYIYLDNRVENFGLSYGAQQRYLSSVEHLLGDGMESSFFRSPFLVIVESCRIDLHSSQINILLINGCCSYSCAVNLISGCSLLKFCFMVVLQARISTDEERTTLKLLDETRDMMESHDFNLVLQSCLDIGFARLMDNVGRFFEPSSAPLPEHSRVNSWLTNPSLPLAKLIPIFNGQVHSICSDTPNHFIQELLTMDVIENFAANLYEAFSTPEQL